MARKTEAPKIYYHQLDKTTFVVRIGDERPRIYKDIKEVSGKETDLEELQALRKVNKSTAIGIRVSDTLGRMLKYVQELEGKKNISDLIETVLTEYCSEKVVREHSLSKGEEKKK